MTPEQRIHGDATWDRTKTAMREADRVIEFNKLYGEWPPQQFLRQETPAYSARMAEREAEIMRIQDSNLRWNAWMFLVQARLMPNFTQSQWEVVRAPEAAYEKLLASFHEKLPTAHLEVGDLGVFGGETAKKISQEDLNYEILGELLPLHEAWAGFPLVPAAAYGVRVYQPGNMMVDHLDILESHVISSVLHIDSDLDEPYPLEIEDANGFYAKGNLKPGDMMFYESAKCYHKRSVPMKGRYYASLFLHYRPKTWTFDRDLVIYGIPPHWLQQPKPQESQVKVAFKLVASALSPVELFWISETGREHFLKQLVPGGHDAFDTHIGHTFAARQVITEGYRVLGRWTVDREYMPIDVPPTLPHNVAHSEL